MKLNSPIFARSGTKGMRGFSMLELLVAVAILVLLLGLLYAVYAKVIVEKRKIETQAILTRLRQALEKYRHDFGHLPYRDADARPQQYLNSSCAPMGGMQTDESTNRAIVSLLIENGEHFQQGWRKDGVLRDAYGTPIAIRLLRMRSDGRGSEETIRVWSYGPDRKNGVQVTTIYHNLDAPDYDRLELEAMQAQPGSDDIVSW